MSWLAATRSLRSGALVFRGRALRSEDSAPRLTITKTEKMVASMKPRDYDFKCWFPLATGHQQLTRGA